MKPHYFSLEEANAALDIIRPMMEEIQSLPKYSSFMILLHAQALPDVQASKALLKDIQFVVVHLRSSTEAMPGTLPAYSSCRS